MPRSILIVDANPGFAGMLNQALAAVGFECTLAASARTAALHASTAHVDLAILDFHLPDAPAEELIQVLRSLRPNIILLGIPPDNNPDNPIVSQLGLQGALTKPFYLPDLVPYIAGLLGVEVAPPPEEYPEEAAEGEPGRIKPPPPKKSTSRIPWLEDSRRADAWLEQVSAANPVLACMITRGAELHAGAGALSREKLALLARRVSEMWTGTSGGTILQYVRIPPDDTECLFYSVSIALDLDLTLFFDRQTTLTAARRKAQVFQKALGKPPATGTLHGPGEPGPAKKTTGSLRGAGGEGGVVKKVTGALRGTAGEGGMIKKVTDALRRRPPDGS
jgi:CheY-like chemotaxis protein